MGQSMTNCKNYFFVCLNPRKLIATKMSRLLKSRKQIAEKKSWFTVGLYGELQRIVNPNVNMVLQGSEN